LSLSRSGAARRRRGFAGRGEALARGAQVQRAGLEPGGDGEDVGGGGAQPVAQQPQQGSAQHAAGAAFGRRRETKLFTTPVIQ
jgi:hypothetical protein